MNELKTFLSFSLGRMAGVLWPLAIVVALSSCSQPQDKLIKMTLEQANPADVRKMAIPLLLKYQNSNDISGTIVPYNEVPEVIKSLPLFSMQKDYIRTWWPDDDHNAMEFVNGGGFGLWGIVVCRDVNDRRYDKSPVCKYWGDGIYIYKGD